jgi:uncharacterized protein YkwD
MKILSILLLITVSVGFTPVPEPTSYHEICLGTEEKKLYDMIMEYRRTKGLPPIPLSAKLTQVAQTHTRDLSDHYTFDANNKCNPHSWSDKGTWTSCCYTPDHKEAACMWQKPKEIAGYEGNGFEIAFYSSAGATPKEGLDGWKASPGHNPLLINTGIWKDVKWNAIGISLYKSYGLVWFGEVGDDVTPENCR